MRLFVFLGSLLVLALLAALVVPPYVDWNQFKNRFEMQASLVLGQKVTVIGETSATLLPLPSVTFTKVQIGDEKQGDAVMAAESFRMNVELAPLLKGDFVIVDMVLDRPKFDISLDENGGIRWPERKRQKQVVSVGGREIELPDVELNEVALENITVKNGVVRFRDKRFGREEVLSGISGTASAKTLAGPWRGDGELTFEGQRVRLRGSTGRFQKNDSLRVKLDIQPQEVAYDFELDGPLSFKTGVPSFDGGLIVKPLSKQSDTDLITFRRPGVDKTLPIRLEADLNLATAGASIPAFKLDIGQVDDPYVLSGTAQAVFGEEVSIRVRAEGRQINVERLESASQTAAKGVGLIERLEALRSVLVRIPRLGVNAEANLFLPAIIAGDTVIREVGMDFKPVNGAENNNDWIIRNLEAQFPGRTELRASGLIKVGNKLGYEGELIVASRQPSGLAAWLGASKDASVKDLKNAGFSAKANISAEEASFEDLEIVLDGQVLKGSVKRTAEPQEGGRPRLVSALNGEAVNFDQLLAVVGLFSDADSSATIGKHDLDVDLVAERLTALGTQARNVTAKVSLTGESLNIRRLDIAALRGAAVSLTGSLDGFPQKPIGRIVGSIEADNAVDFLNFSRNHLPVSNWFNRFASNPSLLQDTQLSLTLDAKEDSYKLAMNGSVAKSETEFELSGDDFSKPLDQQNIDSRVVLVNDDATVLMAQIGLPIVPIKKADRGAFRLNASGVPKRGMKVDTALTVREGYVSASGLLSSQTNAGSAGISGALNVVAEAQDIDPLILLSGLSLPGYGMGKAAKISGQFTFDGQKYRVKGLKGNLDGSEFTGSLTLDGTAEPRSLISGNLSVDLLDYAAIAGLVHTGVKDESGERVDPVLSGLDATLDLTAAKITLPTDQALLTGFSSKVLMRDGDISFADLAAKWGQGKVTGNISLGQSAAAKLMNGNISIADGNVQRLTALASFPNKLRGKFGLQFAFETAGETTEEMINRLTGSGALNTNKIILEGLDGGLFKNVLAEADKIDDEKLAATAATLLRDTAFGGTTNLKDANFDFNVGSGLLRASNVDLKGEKIDLNVNTRLNLTSRATEIEVSVAFDPGKENVLGASPDMTLKLAGQPNALQRELDVSLFAAYLGLRVSERREREFKAQQAQILERQRLQRSARIFNLKEQAKRIAAEEEERIKQLKIEQEKRRKQEEARRRREELERARLEAELKAAREEALREAALEAGRRAERKKQIEILRKQAEDAARRLQDSLPKLELTD